MLPDGQRFFLLFRRDGTLAYRTPWRYNGIDEVHYHEAGGQVTWTINGYADCAATVVGRRMTVKAVRPPRLLFAVSLHRDDAVSPLIDTTWEGLCTHINNMGPKGLCRLHFRSDGSMVYTHFMHDREGNPTSPSDDTGVWSPDDNGSTVRVAMQDGTRWTFAVDENFIFGLGATQYGQPLVMDAHNLGVSR